MSELEKKIKIGGAIQIGTIAARVHALDSLDIHRCEGGELTLTVVSVAKGKPNRVRLWLGRDQVAYLASCIAGPSDNEAVLAVKSVYVVRDRLHGEYVDGSAKRTLLEGQALKFRTQEEAELACVRVNDRVLRVDLPGE